MSGSGDRPSRRGTAFATLLALASLQAPRIAQADGLSTALSSPTQFTAADGTAIQISWQPTVSGRFLGLTADGRGVRFATDDGREILFDRASGGILDPRAAAVPAPTGAPPAPSMLRAAAASAPNYPEGSAQNLSCKKVCELNKQYRLESQANGDLTQLDAHCQSYEQADAGKTFDYILLGMNTGALATCISACVVPLFNAPLVMACNVLGITGSAAELIHSLTMKNKGAGAALGALAPGMGIGMQAKGLATTGNPFAIGDKLTSAQARLGNLSERGVTDGRLFSQQESVDKLKGQASQSKKNACLASVFLGIQITTRMMSINSQSKTRSSACQSVAELLSDSPRLRVKYASALPDSRIDAGADRMNEAKQMAAMAAATAGMNRLTSAANSLDERVIAGTDSVANLGLESYGSSSLGIAGSVIRSAATASGPLIEAGIDRTLAQASAKQDLRALVREVERGATPQQIIQSLLPAQASALAPGFRDLASALQAAPPEAAPFETAPTLLADAAPPGAVGAPAAAPSLTQGALTLNAPTSAANPLAAENPPSDTAQRLPAGMVVATPAGLASDDPEIHPATGKSIFEIVSHRIAQSGDRIETLPWSSPYNQVIDGR